MGEQKWRVDPEKPRDKFAFMSMKRLIARLDIKGPNVIKGIQMDGQRIVGDPAELASKYYEAGIDEIFYIDTVASLYGRENITAIVEQVAQSIFVPLTVGGGIRSLDDARLMLRSGADKVAMNSAAVSNPRLLQEVSSTFGSQCAVLSVEAKRVENDWEVFTNNGRDRTGVFVGKWIESAQEFGVGEVFITSIDRDGTKRGLDLDLKKLARSSTDLPVIGSGGVGSVQDFYRALHEADLDGICVGAALHSGTVEINQIRNELAKHGIEMRKVS